MMLPTLLLLIFPPSRGQSRPPQLSLAALSSRTSRQEGGSGAQAATLSTSVATLLDQGGARREEADNATITLGMADWVAIRRARSALTPTTRPLTRVGPTTGASGPSGTIG